MKHFNTVLLFTGALLLGGCFGPKTPDGMPKLEPVTVTVLQGDVPLANATLNLKPLEPSTTNNFTCGGTTNEEGVATIVTHGQYKGAPLGSTRLPFRASSAREPPLRQVRSTKSLQGFTKSISIQALLTKNSTSLIPNLVPLNQRL